MLETIKVENGRLINLPLHQERMNRSRRDLFGFDDEVGLQGNIHIPANVSNGIFKCRVTYREKIEMVGFEPYRIKTIESLKIVHADQIDYSYKYNDRSIFEELMKQKGDADDVLIIKDGKVTDTSFCNIIFWDGTNWITPGRPLLRGTQRENLLRKRLIGEEDIRLIDLSKFQKFILINAMLDFDGSRAVDISGIAG
nr:aminotransferase class IV [Bacteroidota bacterium]